MRIYTVIRYYYFWAYQNMTIEATKMWFFHVYMRRHNGKTEKGRKTLFQVTRGQVQGIFPKREQLTCLGALLRIVAPFAAECTAAPCLFCSPLASLLLLLRDQIERADTYH